MHILMIFSTNIPVCDGIASHILEFARRLRSRGHNITLLTRGRWNGTEEFEYQGFKVIKAPFYPLYPLHVYIHNIFVRRIIKALNPQPDIIHLHSPLVPSPPRKWPIVTTFHTPMLVDTAYIENIGIKTFLIKLMGRTTSYWIEKKLLNISDAVVTSSQGVAEELKTYYGYSKNNLYPINNVVDADFFKPGNYLPENKKILYVGRMAYRKGLFEIINSARHIVNKHPDVMYVLVGSGPLEDQIRKMVERYGLVSNFEFCGEIRDASVIRQYYQDSCAVLIPSHYEGLPITLLEAMACGKPIVSTDASFSTGVLENGVNALLIRPREVGELSEAILKLLSSEELRKTLGVTARKTVIEKMNAERNTNSLEEVYIRSIKRFRQAQSAC